MGFATQKQRAALIRFGLSVEEVNKMSFSDASARLDDLIGKARAKKASSNTPKATTGAATIAPAANSFKKELIENQATAKAAVSARLKTAIEIVDERLPEAKNYADYYALLAECMHQLGAAVWLDKV